MIRLKYGYRVPADQNSSEEDVRSSPTHRRSTSEKHSIWPVVGLFAAGAAVIGISTIIIKKWFFSEPAGKLPPPAAVG